MALRGGEARAAPGAVRTRTALVEMGGDDPQRAEGPLGILRAVGIDEWAALGERYR